MESSKIKAKAVKCFLGTRLENYKYFETALAKKYGMPDLLFGDMTKGDMDRKSICEVLSLELAKQYIEISRLLRNYDALRMMRNSVKQQYYRTVNMSRHLGYMEYAFDVLENGKDDQNFNEKLKEYNDYIESHIERDGLHKTFRTVSKKELREEEKKPCPMTVQQMREKNIDKYNEIGQLFYKQCTGKNCFFSKEKSFEK